MKEKSFCTAKIVLIFLITILLFLAKSETAEARQLVDNQNGVTVEYENDTLYISKCGESFSMDDFETGERKSWDGFYIKTIVISGEVTHIGSSAFENCVRLEKIVIQKGKSELSIGKRAFYGCENLKFFASGERIRDIGGNAFGQCKQLKSVDFSNDKIEEVPFMLFAECEALETVKLSNSVKKLDDYCFSGCLKLNNITFPENLMYIGEGAFLSCGSLDKIYLDNIKELVDIGEYAFRGCTALKGVVMPLQLGQIGNGCFSQCKSLKYVSFPGDPQGKVGTNIFEEGNGNGTILYLVSKNYEKYNAMLNTNVNWREGFYLGSSNTQIKLDEQKLLYSGKDICPKVQIKMNSNIVKDDQYTVSYCNNRDVGTGIIVIEGLGRYAGHIQREFSIIPADYTIKITNEKELKMMVVGRKNARTINVSTNSLEPIQYESSNSKIVSVGKDGKVIPNKQGKAVVTVWANKHSGSNYNVKKTSVKIEVLKDQKIKIHNKKLKTNITDKHKNIKLKVSTLGGEKPYFRSTNKKVLTVNKNGVIRIKGSGKASVVVYTKKSKQYAPKEKKISFKVKPTMKVKMSHNRAMTKQWIYLKNISPKTILHIKVYDSRKKNYLYRDFTKKIGKEKNKTVEIDTSGYANNYFIEVYLEKDGVKSKIATNRKK